MYIPENIKYIIKLLEQCGHEAYVVGGCVRDSLMNIQPHDYDITTSATPDQMIEALEGVRIFKTGIQHGTITAVVDKENIEITTFRIDGEYEDNRRPKEVGFTKKISEDISRRDFTINAIAYNPNIGYIDIFNGAEDVENRMIRAVGCAERRFNEDALRILRGLRFASRLGFTIEEKTAKAMRENKRLLDNISKERIATELKGILMGKYAGKILMDFSDIIIQFIPEIKPCVGFEQNNPYHIYDVYEHTARTIDNSPFEEHIRLAMLFHDTGKPSCYSETDNRGHFYGHSNISEKIALQVMDRLKMDNLTKNTVTTLVKYHDINFLAKEKWVKKWMVRLGSEMFFKLVDVKKADDQAKSEIALKNLPELDKIINIAEKILKDKLCISLKSLDIKGNDIMDEFGIEGKRVGEMLNLAFKEVVSNRCHNNKEDIIKFLKDVY